MAGKTDQLYDNMTINYVGNSENNAVHHWYYQKRRRKKSTFIRVCQGIYIIYTLQAAVAQWLGRRTTDRKVPGSNPVRSHVPGGTAACLFPCKSDKGHVSRLIGQVEGYCKKNCHLVGSNNGVVCHRRPLVSKGSSLSTMVMTDREAPGMVVSRTFMLKNFQRCDSLSPDRAYSLC